MLLQDKRIRQLPKKIHPTKTPRLQPTQTSSQLNPPKKERKNPPFQIYPIPPVSHTVAKTGRVTGEGEGETGKAGGGAVKESTHLPITACASCCDSHSLLARLSRSIRRPFHSGVFWEKFLRAKLGLVVGVRLELELHGHGHGHGLQREREELGPWLEEQVPENAVAAAAAARPGRPTRFPCPATHHPAPRPSGHPAALARLRLLSPHPPGPHRPVSRRMPSPHRRDLDPWPLHRADSHTLRFFCLASHAHVPKDCGR